MLERVGHVTRERIESLEWVSFIVEMIGISRAVWNLDLTGPMTCESALTVLVRTV